MHLHAPCLLGRGKLLNVRDASASQVTGNAEIQAIKQILGLQHGKVREGEWCWAGRGWVGVDGLAAKKRDGAPREGGGVALLVSITEYMRGIS